MVSVTLLITEEYIQSIRKDEIEMFFMNGVPAIYMIKNAANTTGLLDNYVDNSILAVGPVFESVIDHVRVKFDSKS